MWIIKDWANNDMFDERLFKSYDEAADFLMEFLNDSNMDIDEWFDEYWIRNIKDCKQ